MSAEPLWVAHFVSEAVRLEAEVLSRREVAPHDPVAAGIDWAAQRLRRAIAALNNDMHLLTPEQWGAMQPKRVPPQTVRRWIRLGEIDSVDGARGSLIPKDAQRRRPAPLPQTV